MALPFNPLSIPSDPNDCAPWLWEALNRLNRHAGQSSQSVAAISRGEAPDGSGDPLIDLTQYFYLPGRFGGQVGYGGEGSAENLTLSSTRHSTKGFIYIGSAATTMFDEVNQRFGINLAEAPLARIHMRSTAAAQLWQRWESTASAPVTVVCNGTTTVTSAALFASVHIGDVVKATGVTTNTLVTARASDSSITVSIAIPASVTSVTFSNQITFVDQGFSGGGALTCTVGGSGTNPSIASGLRLVVSGDGRAANAAFRQYLQAGPTNLNFAFTGFNAADGNSFWHLALYTNFNTSSGIGGALTNNSRVGINIDPFDFSSSAAAAQCDSLHVARRTSATSGTPTIIVEALASSTEMALSIRGLSIGTAPSRTIATSDLGGFRHDGELSLANAGTKRGILSAFQSGGSGTPAFTLREIAGTTVLLRVGKVSAWSDTLSEANSPYMQWGALNSTHRAVVVGSDGFGTLTRLGFASTYTIFSTSSMASMRAPEASPTVLTSLNTTTGGADASIVLKVQTERTTQTGNLLSIISGVASTVDTVVNARNVMAAGRILALSGVLFTDDNSTIANARMAGFDTSLVAQGATRSHKFFDRAGTIATDTNIAVDDAGNVITADGDVVLA